MFECDDRKKIPVGMCGNYYLLGPTGPTHTLKSESI